MSKGAKVIFHFTFILFYATDGAYGLLACNSQDAIINLDSFSIGPNSIPAKQGYFVVYQHFLSFLRKKKSHPSLLAVVNRVPSSFTSLSHRWENGGMRS